MASVSIFWPPIKTLFQPQLQLLIVGFMALLTSSLSFQYLNFVNGRGSSPMTTRSNLFDSGNAVIGSH